MNQANQKKNEDFSEFTDRQFQIASAKPQIPQKDKVKKIDQQNYSQQVQKGIKIVNFNKNQQNQSYLTSLIFKNANIDNFSVELKPYDQEYAQLMSIIDQRTIGKSEVVLDKTRNKKYEICYRQIEQISNMADFEIQLKEKATSLDEKSKKLFQKLFKALQKKIEEIAQTKKENEQKEKLEGDFENNLKQKDLKFYDEVHSLLSQIKQNKNSQQKEQQPSAYSKQQYQAPLNSQADPVQMQMAGANQYLNQDFPHQISGPRAGMKKMMMMGQPQDNRMEEEYAYPQEYSQDANQMKGYNQNNRRGVSDQRYNMQMEEEEQFVNQMQVNQGQFNMESQIQDNSNIRQKEDQGEDASIALNFCKNQINEFYEKVNAEKIKQVYDMYEELQKSLDKLNKDLQINVEEKIVQKKIGINQLFSEIKSRINKQIQQLPINYFMLKKKEVFDYYHLPPYNESNINIQSYEKLLADQNKSIKAYQIKFSIEDLRRLNKDMLINDNLLDCYASYLRESHRNIKQQNQSLDRNDMSEIIIFSHLFFETQYESMRIKKDEGKAFMDQFYPTSELFKPESIDRFGFIVNVDLHNIKHWIFLGVYNKTREIIYYDSASSNNAYYKNISTALTTFFQQISGHQYIAKKADKCPRQNNGTDCGMFVVKYMQNFAYNTPQEFDQAHITELREKMYTFFPMLSYQKELRKVDYETLQYFEGRIDTVYDKVQPELSKDINNC